MTGVKIATFAFNVTSTVHFDNNNLNAVHPSDKEAAKTLANFMTSDGKIDEIISGFCKLSHVAEIVDIKIHTECILPGNGEGYNLLRRVYTIIYKEQND